METEKIELVIADDNREFAEILREYLSSQEDMDVIGVAEDGEKTMQLVKSRKPDILILDLVMPVLDGIGVIERINGLSRELAPKIIVLSGMCRDHITKNAIELGADYYIVKPFELSVLADRIRQLFLMDRAEPELELIPTILSKRTVEKSKDEDLETQISGILHEVGIPAHIKGYFFVREAIELVVHNNLLIGELTKGLYPQIAEKYNTTPSRVERAIRHCIEISVARCNQRLLYHVIGYIPGKTKEKPTNGEFIALVSERLRYQAGGKMAAGMTGTGNTDKRTI